MLRMGVKRLPVVDEQGGLAGIVTRSDLLKVFLRPDPAIRWEVDHDIVRGDFGIADGEVQVEVRDGVIRLRGEVERRSAGRPAEWFRWTMQPDRGRRSSTPAAALAPGRPCEAPL